MGTSYDLNEINSKADSLAIQNNGEINPKMYNNGARDNPLFPYYEVYDSRGNFKYTGKIQEVTN